MTSARRAGSCSGCRTTGPTSSRALITMPRAASIFCSSLAFEMPRLAVASRRFHFTGRVPSIGRRRAAARPPRRPRRGWRARGHTGPLSRSRNVLVAPGWRTRSSRTGNCEAQKCRRTCGVSFPARRAGGVRRPRPATGRKTSSVARAEEPSRVLRPDGNNGAPGRSWSSPNWPRTSPMNQLRLWSAPLISGTSRGLGPFRRAPLPWRTFSLPNRPRSQRTSSRSSMRTSLTRRPTSASSRAAA